MGKIVKAVGVCASIMGIALGVMVDWKFYIMMLSGMILYFAELMMEDA